MRTEASSTDNYNGCKHKQCKGRAGFGRLAVDGSFHSCFLSLSEHSPWFIVHLNGYHPIALIHVALGEADRRRLKMIYIGNTLHQKKGSPQGEWLISPFAQKRAKLPSHQGTELDHWKNVSTIKTLAIIESKDIRCNIACIAW